MWPGRQKNNANSVSTLLGLKGFTLSLGLLFLLSACGGGSSSGQDEERSAIGDDADHARAEPDGETTPDGFSSAAENPVSRSRQPAVFLRRAIAGASVSVTTTGKKLIKQLVTDEEGYINAGFDIRELQEDFYIVAAACGEICSAELANPRPWHAIVGKQQLLENDWQVNPQTDIAFQNTDFYFKAGYPTEVLQGHLDRMASWLVESDSNGDNVLDYRDLFSASSDSIKRPIGFENYVRAIETDGPLRLLAQSWATATLSVWQNQKCGANSTHGSVVTETHVFLLCGYAPAELYILSYADRETLHFDKSIKLHSNPRDIARYGDSLYFNARDQIGTIDISNPSQAEVVFRPDYDRKKVVFVAGMGSNGDTTIMLTSKKIHFFDTSDPYAPRQIHVMDTRGYSMALEKQFFAVTLRDSVALFDISHPREPVKLDEIPLSEEQYVRAINIDNNRLYLAISDDVKSVYEFGLNGLVLVSRLENAGFGAVSFIGDEPYLLEHGSMERVPPNSPLYPDLIDYYSDGYAMGNYSHLSPPDLTIDTLGPEFKLESIQHLDSTLTAHVPSAVIASEGNQLYGLDVDSTSTGYDLKLHSSRYQIESGALETRDREDVFFYSVSSIDSFRDTLAEHLQIAAEVDNHRLFLSTYVQQLSIIQTPEMLRDGLVFMGQLPMGTPLSAVELPQIPIPYRERKGRKVAGSDSCLSERGSMRAGSRVVDDPLQLQGDYQSREPFFVEYQNQECMTITVFDIVNSGKVAEGVDIRPPVISKHFALKDNVLYIAGLTPFDMQRELVIMDVRDVDAPVEISRTSLSNKSRTLGIYRDTLVLQNQTGNLELWDISDASKISRYRTLEIRHRITKARMEGESIFVWTDTDELVQFVFGSEGVEQQTYKMPSNVEHLDAVARGSLLYVIDEKQLSVYRLQETENPTFLSQIPISPANKIDIMGQYLVLRTFGNIVHLFQGGALSLPYEKPDVFEDTQQLGWSNTQLFFAPAL